MFAQILPNLVEPGSEERPTDFADRIGRLYTTARPIEHRKRLGQFLTPIGVADFMASLINGGRETVRILDPGAGSGVLSCALAEALVRHDRAPKRIAIDAVESDREIHPFLFRSLSYLQSMLNECNVELTYRCIPADFVLSHAEELRRSESLFERGTGDHDYDVVICNPPYFKLSKSDPRAQAAADIVHGQPNVYALFMAIAAAILAPRGELVFITPRSFTSGPYFRRFRERFFGCIQLEALHVFDSRRDAFNRDGVLQENVILKGRRRTEGSSAESESRVRVSVSVGASDIGMGKARSVSLSTLLDLESKEKMLRIHSSEDELEILNRVDGWSGSLHMYGLEVSTGPVVPFRATHLISAEGEVEGASAPLLWLQNVQRMRIEWPTTARRKPQFISRVSDDARPLLVQDGNYVLLRRFSAKEEPRRLTAAPLLKGHLRCEWIGIENHLNYIHRPGGTLSEEEALGLAVLYSSMYMDTYFRALNGSTQVSATEIRHIPLPSLEQIIEIGRHAKQTTLSDARIDDLARVAFADDALNGTEKHAHA